MILAFAADLGYFVRLLPRSLTKKGPAMSARRWISHVFSQRTSKREKVSQSRPAMFEVLECRLAPATQLISNGIPLPSDDASYSPNISADGRYVVFESGASNLVAGDNNGAYDVFVKDTLTGVTTRVSTNSAGLESSAGFDSVHPAVSGNGRYIAFYSDATNLVATDTNKVSDIFLKDAVTGTTTRVSTNSQGTQANKMSDSPAISADGRMIAFVSAATNLVTDDLNLRQDVFVKDIVTGTTTRVSTSSSGEEASNDSDLPSISADGRTIAFSSSAKNLVPNDTNGFPDIFVKDLATGTTKLVSVSSAGVQADNGSTAPALSGDGRYVAYVSRAANLAPNDSNDNYDVFVTDLQTMTTTRVSTDASGGQGNEASGQQPGRPSISANGRYVAFWSTASNLVPGDDNNRPDIFVKDTQTGRIALVSVNAAGTPGDDFSIESAISADGRFVAFTSSAGNLAAGDSNGLQDVFLASLGEPTNTSLVAIPLATTGGSPIMLTATVSPSPGVSGTVTFLDNGAPLASIPVVGGVAAFSTTTLAIGGHQLIAMYNGAVLFASSVSNAQSVLINAPPPPPPNVVSVTPNANLPSLAGVQRSRVGSVVVVFDQAVQLDSDAVTIALHTNNVALNGVSQPSGYGSLPAALALATTDKISWTVTFSGNTEAGLDGVGSLKDGVYDLNIAAAKVHPSGAPAISMAANSTTTFHRLFGDSNAPGTPPGGTTGVDVQAIVNSGDNLNFRGAFNSPTSYKAIFDANGDGFINSVDNLQFRNRFNSLLTWKV